MAAPHLTRCDECGEFVHYMFDWCDDVERYLCDVCVDELRDSE